VALESPPRPTLDVSSTTAFVLDARGVSDASPAIGISSWRRALRDTRGYVFLDILIVALIFLADRQHLIVLSKTPYLLVLGWLSLWARGLAWRDVGLSKPLSWRRTVWLGLLAGLTIEALELFVTQPLLVGWTGQYPDLTPLLQSRGNLKLLLLLVAGSWTLAAFGEELVWRGYLLNRLCDLFGRQGTGLWVSLASVSVAFGLAHADQGMTGVIENSLDGALLGLLYLASGRNLWMPIVAHGVTDTVDSLLLYLGWYPGM
jgi:membrane protease YdiL (CAAX protease family)